MPTKIDSWGRTSNKSRTKGKKKTEKRKLMKVEKKNYNGWDQSKYMKEAM